MIQLKQILVPLDGSPLAEQALPLALSLAHQYEGQLILLSVTDVAVADQFVIHPEALQLMKSAMANAWRDANHYLQTKQEELQQQVHGVQTLVAEGSPAEAIIKAATEKDVDLIVMSSHGRGGLARWSFGSVADKVVRHSPCLVLIVRQGAETNIDASSQGSGQT